jgi:hypothetical protein
MGITEDIIMPTYADIASVGADTVHALATVAIPALLTLALVCWCTEFYRRTIAEAALVLGVAGNNCDMRGADCRDVS